MKEQLVRKIIDLENRGCKCWQTIVRNVYVEIS